MLGGWGRENRARDTRGPTNKSQIYSEHTLKRIGDRETKKVIKYLQWRREKRIFTQIGIRLWSDNEIKR